jgi:hypothetical protein
MKKYTPTKVRVKIMKKRLTTMLEYWRRKKADRQRIYASDNRYLWLSHLYHTGRHFPPIPLLHTIYIDLHVFGT